MLIAFLRFCLLCFSCLLLALPAQAELSIEEAQAQIQAFEQTDELSEDEKDVLAIWQESYDLLKKTKELIAEQSQFDHNKDQLAVEAESLKAQSDELEIEEPDFSLFNITEQEEALQENKDYLSHLQDKLLKAQAEFISTQTQPERHQQKISTALKDLQNAREKLLVLETKTLEESTKDAQRFLLQAEIEYSNASLVHLRQQLQINPLLQKQLNAKRQRLSKQIEQQKKLILKRQQFLAEQRQQQIYDLLELDTPEAAKYHPAFKLQKEQNKLLANRLSKINKSIESLQNEQLTLLEQLKHSRQLVQNLQEQIEALQGSLLLSQLLYQQQRQLPRPNSLLLDDSELADLRIEQFQFTELEAVRMDPQEKLEQFLASDQIQDPDLITTLKQSIDIENQLVSILKERITELLNLAINNRVTYEQLSSALKQNQSLINEQLFWMPSSRAMNGRWWKQLPGSTADALNQLQQQKLPQAFVSGLKHHGAWMLIIFAVIALIWRQRQRWQNELTEINKSISYIRYDRQTHTPKAMVISLLLRSPYPLLIGSTCLIWFRQSYPSSALLFHLTWQFALGLWLVLWSREILKPNGIGMRHFRWSEKGSTIFRRKVTLFGVLLLPLMWTIQLGYRQPISLMDNPLGSLIFVITSAALVVVFWQPPTRLDNKLAFFPTLLSIVLLSLPLGVAFASATGYHYSAIIVAQRLLISATLVWVCYLGYNLANRALVVTARKIAYRRALQRREARRKEEEEDGGESSQTLEVTALDLYRFNEQSLRLARWAALFSIGIILYFIWADIISAFSYLDHITLWQYQGEGGASLANLLNAIIIFAITVILARNLPGLINVTLLSRLALKPGSSYTITALLTYILTSAGVVVALATLGLSWDKLQWLVAALGFGLGFGVQEIFANFISGIILLFERPIRVGDFVTIGEYIGTVNRIRIRATTIRDIDNLEVILPNKAFVTDRFTNWTLTDTITRIVLKVGFDYNSDPSIAKQILLTAADENQQVLDDPEPQSLFIKMGQNTMEYELRVHVRLVSERMPTIDQLNQRIVEIAQERGVGVALNHHVVTLKNANGDETTIAEGKPSDLMSK